MKFFAARTAVLLQAYIACAFAIIVNDDMNITIAFYSPANATCTDGSGPPPSAISLTTYSFPDDYVCINVSDIFSQPNNTGWYHYYQGLHLTPDRWGINWTIHNHDSYDPSINYTGIWIQQMNLTGYGEGQGKSAGRKLQTYGLPNCRQVGRIDEPLSAHPWYKMTCQTQRGGQCHEAPKRIMSFAIQRAWQNIAANKGKCSNWYQEGAAARFAVPTWGLLAGAATVAAFFLF